MTHTILTFISPVKPEKADELRALLKEMGDDPEKNSSIPLRKLKRLHFASLFLHEPSNELEKKEYGPTLVFENNFDGDLDSYLEDLYDLAGNGLRQIYSNCRDFSVTNGGDRQGVLAYLKGHVVRPNAYHVGNTGRSVERILQEHNLRDSLETRADALVQDGRPSAPSLWQTLKDFVRTSPDFSWVPGADPRQTFLERYVPWVKLVLELLIALTVIILLLPLVFILAVVLFYKESTDSVKSSAADSENVRKLVESEDHTHSVQNHMASITIVKPGWLRRLTLWLCCGR